MVACLGLAACASPSIINYRQVGACNGYVAGNRVVSAGPNAAFVVFKIENIDASKADANFDFDPARMYASLSTQRFIEPGLQLTGDLGLPAATSKNVPKGANVAVNGYGVIVVPTATVDGATEANQTNYMLNYQSLAGGSGALPTKLNASQTAWPVTPDCRAIHF